MSKVTLDMKSFKALASDTRLDILKTLDGKKMNLQEISKSTDLNKATLHEHLSKLTEAGLVKRKERKGHKWVYYKLTWKGEGLLHPENTRIVVLFSATFISLAIGVIQIINFLTSKTSNMLPQSINEGIKGKKNYYHDSIPNAVNNTSKITRNGGYGTNGQEGITSFSQEPIFLYIAIACFIIFMIILAVSIWRYKKNKLPKL